MEEVTIKAYKAIDGSIHESKEDCIERDKLLGVKATLVTVNVRDILTCKLETSRVLILGNGNIDCRQMKFLKEYVCQELFGSRIVFEGGANVFFKNMIDKWFISDEDSYDYDNVGEFLFSQTKMFTGITNVVFIDGDDKVVIDKFENSNYHSLEENLVRLIKNTQRY